MQELVILDLNFHKLVHFLVLNYSVRLHHGKQRQQHRTEEADLNKVPFDVHNGFKVSISTESPPGKSGGCSR